ncbi:MAG: response regulator transcription factor [Gemmatimonadaceae bacterium]
MIRVLIVDDHELIREGLAELLSRSDDISVVAKADSGAKALALFREHNPDVSLIDLRMAPMSGIETIVSLKKEYPDARIIMLSAFDTDDEIYQGLRAGAASYLLKDVAWEELLGTIRAVHNGEKRVPSHIAAKLADHMSKPELTARQLDTLRLIVAGRSNQEIADQLYITEGTVKAHVKAILSKLGARDRTQAATLAIKRGIVHQG